MQDTALEQCRSSIEHRLDWGDADHWTTQDFEDLSFQMQERTGRAISATTLKRLWGRVAYHSSPSRHSLDTLALFIGHPSWRDFVQTVDLDTPLAVSTDAPADGAVVKSARPRFFSHGLRYLVVSVFLLGFGFAVWAGVDSGTSDKVVAAAVAFQSRPVTSGVPNTVIFEYDVSSIKADSFFIQQSWDQRRRTLVSPERQTHTSIYFRPGFFNAKLIADDAVVAEKPVHVTTEGWIALIEGDPTPIYLTDAFSSAEGTLAVTPTWLQSHGPDATATYQVLEYYNVRTFDDARTDSFSLETAVRQTVEDGRYPCKCAEVSVLGERGAFAIPLSMPGCVGKMGLLVGMRYLEGATNDLSAFGVDLAAWQRVRLDVAGGTVSIQAGENTPFVTQMDEDVGRVVGLRFRFEGTGAVDYVTLRGADGEVVYDEAF